MNRRAFAIAAIALICISAAGIGYAATIYTGTTYTESDVSYNEYSIILTDTTGEAAVSTAIEFAQPTHTTPVEHDQGDYSYYETTITAASPTSSDYRLKITCPGDSLSVRCFITLDDVRSWTVIDHITINVYANERGSSPTATYTVSPPSEIDASVTYQTVSIPYKLWTEDQSALMTLNKADMNYITFTVAYRAVTLQYDSGEDLNFLNLSGMEVKFTAATADPSPPEA